jgi:hypothetical protein
MQSDILYYITFPTSTQIFLWISIPLASTCVIKQIHPLKFSQQILQINSTEWQQAFLLCPEKWHCTHIMKAHCIAHITVMCVIGICLASFQMTVILWHLLGTVIQCKPKRMQEV